MKRLALAAAVVTASASHAEQLPMEHVLVSVPIHKKQAETALPVTVLSGEELQRQNEKIQENAKEALSRPRGGQ